MEILEVLKQVTISYIYLSGSNGYTVPSIYLNILCSDPNTLSIDSDKQKHMSSIEKTEVTPIFPKKDCAPDVKEHPPSLDTSDDEDDDNNVEHSHYPNDKSKLTTHKTSGLHSPNDSTRSFDLQVSNWRMEKLEVDSKSGSEEEFFDCLGKKYK